MNLPTIQIPYYFTDQRHSGYADAVMAGKVSSANFVFVSDVEDIAPILPEDPTCVSVRPNIFSARLWPLWPSRKI